MRSEAIEATTPDGWWLRVEFQWHRDRFHHVIAVVDSAGRFMPLLESIEGTASDDWPPSPPLQSLHRESRPAGHQVTLLVGMAGGSYWSASVETPTGGSLLTFDIACRHAKSPNWLGSRYRQVSDASIVAVDADGATLMNEDSVLAIEADSITAQPKTNRANTSRWKYAVRLQRRES